MKTAEEVATILRSHQIKVFATSEGDQDTDGFVQLSSNLFIQIGSTYTYFLLCRDMPSDPTEILLEDETWTTFLIHLLAWLQTNPIR